ncbi:Ubiquitin-like domain-containing protein [Durusdinium trenchii]|uniref:Ubiquitin-like domain-containing protein n=1 Tax=Durusdinium trenchii TaxID=1381693 RepID=A0ABP0S450_9DINO
MSRSCEVTGIKATGERGDASSFPVTSLRPAQTYYFQALVRCINLMGTSDWSDPSMPVKIKQDPEQLMIPPSQSPTFNKRVPGLRQISDSRQTFYSDILGGNSGAYGREEFQPSTIQPPFWLEPGHAAFIEAEADWSIQKFRRRAQAAKAALDELEVGLSKLVNAKGELLMGAQLLRDVVQEDETLHATVRRPRIVSNRRAHAFACICMDGSVLAWGAQAAGDCSHVRDQLKEVTSLSAIAGAFAALLENGEVVTWGDHIFGGDTSSLRSTLKEVREVQATAMAFAALRADGTVITWGSSHVGGNCSRVPGFLADPDRNAAMANSKYCTMWEGVLWLPLAYGRLSLTLVMMLSDIEASSRSFCALLADGQVVAWGDPAAGGDCSQEQLKAFPILQMKASSAAFAAVNSQGRVVTWGDAALGGDSRQACLRRAAPARARVDEVGRKW